MQPLFRALSNTMGAAAILLAAACAEDVASPVDSGTVAFSVQPGGTLGQLSLGYQHSCALKTDGTVLCWGYGANGQLAAPSGLVATEVSAGGAHSCALRTDGTVVCWGNGGSGQTTPPAGLVASHISAGYAFTCAVRTDATVVCWGKNLTSELTPVPPGLTSVVGLNAGYRQACALRTDETVVCWGGDDFGEADPPAGLQAVQVSGLFEHNCALQSGGTVACWGLNSNGQLGVPGGLVASQVSAGGNHSCAVRINGTVACWGDNSSGQATPPAGLTNVAQVGTGYSHSCALKTDGTVVCWGYNGDGETDVPGGLNLITTQPQAIAFTSTPPSPAFVGGSYVVTATGGGSGNPVTFGSLTSTTCSVTGSSVAFLAAGACTIAADQLGNTNFFPAPQATQSMNVVEVNVAPVVSGITLPASPVPIATSIGVAANFTDGNRLDSHTATVSWDDGAITAGSVSEASGAGTVSADHAYAGAGVYTVGISVSDGSLTGARSSELDVPAYVVVYDPSAGFVTGGGWITSPGGAYTANLALTGKATFGFVSRYQRGANVPTGNTEFQFQAGGLSFSSTSYEWLVVAGSKAQFKGAGTINGTGSYRFLLTAIDGNLSGGGGADRFRIKIWDGVSGGVIYDNKMGSNEDSSDATALGGGSIVIHQ